MIAAMMQESPSQYWDIEWTYKNGLFADNGFDVLVIRNASETLLSSAVQLTAATKGYVRISVPGISTCKKGIAEAEFSISGMNTQSNGFRFLLSNGNYGCQTMVCKPDADVALVYNYGIDTDSAVNIKLRTIDIGETYKLRLDFDETRGNKMYLNDELLYETDVFSPYYCTGNRLFAQDACTFNMYSLRYKFLEV